MTSAERLRAKRDRRLAANLPVNVPGRSPGEQKRRKTPEARKHAAMRAKVRREHGRGHCKEVLLGGRPCPAGQYLVVKVQPDGSEKIYRAKWCFAHIPKKFRERWGVGEFGGDMGIPNPAGRPRNPNPRDVLKELIENEMAEWLAPIRDALLAMKPTVAGNGRHARIEWSADHRTRLQAVEVALDRVYGKPKQTTDVQGMLTLNADVVVPTDDERQKEVAKILADSGALQTAGLVAAAQNPLSQN